MKTFEDSFDEAFSLCADRLVSLSNRYHLWSGFHGKKNYQKASLEIAQRCIQEMRKCLFPKIWIRDRKKRKILLSAYQELFSIAYIELDEDTIEDSLFVLNSLKELMMRKRNDYGQGNILIFKHIGLMVRMSDKIERLKTLSESQEGPMNESLKDTYMDIANYSLIGIMLLSGTFTRSLKSEK